MQKFKGGVIHWTAGSYKANFVDKKAYHFLYDYDKNKEISTIIPGIFQPEDNLNCNDGKYAAHTGGLNTGFIGVSICAMHGFINSKNVGDYPIKRIQFEKMCCHIATLCRLYNLNYKNWNTHFEIGKKVLSGEIVKNNLTEQNIGKQDIIFLPCFPDLKEFEIGNFIRSKINWYILKL